MDVQGKKSHLVLDICKHLNADTLLANSGSKDYLEKDKQIFDEAGVEISYHNYHHIVYNQHGDIFFEDLSILDLLFSEGENSMRFI